MKTPHFAILVIAAAFGLGALSAPAAAQSSAGASQASTKKKIPKQRVVRQPRAGGQIACTPAGCGRIPANCYPTQGYRWDGMPTGFDVVVCR